MLLLLDRDLEPDLDLIGVIVSTAKVEEEEEDEDEEDAVVEVDDIFAPKGGIPFLVGVFPFTSSRSKGLYRSSYNISFV